MILLAFFLLVLGVVLTTNARTVLRTQDKGVFLVVLGIALIVGSLSWFYIVFAYNV